MFRLGMIWLKIDIGICIIGAFLIVSNWRTLSWRDAVATIQSVDEYCVYTRLTERRGRLAVSRKHPAQQLEPCAGEDVVRDLLRRGYNSAAHVYRVRGVVDGENAIKEFPVSYGSYYLHRRSLQSGMPMAQSRLAPGAKLRLLQSRFSGDVAHRDPERLPMEVWIAAYRVAIGLVFFFGVLFIHGIAYWRETRPKNMGRAAQDQSDVSSG